MKRTARVRYEECNGEHFYRVVVSEGGKVLYAAVKKRAQQAHDFCVRHGADVIDTDIRPSPGVT